MAVIRDRESRRREPLYRDRFAHLFSSPAAITRLDEINHHLDYFEDLISVRHRVFNDEITQLLQSCPDITQLVSLGAGYCTSMLDFVDLNKTNIKGIEVDRDQVLTTKQEVLGKGYLPICVPYDLETKPGHLIDTLSSHSFDNQLSTLFYMEGVLYYLPLDSIIHLLSEIADFLIATDGFLIFDIQLDTRAASPASSTARKFIGLSEDLKSLSYWSALIQDRTSLRVLKYYNLGMADRWNRLATRRSEISSCFFLIGNHP